MKANENIKINVSIEVTQHDGYCNNKTLFSSKREQGGTYDTRRDIQTATVTLAADALKSFREQIGLAIATEESQPKES